MNQRKIHRFVGLLLVLPMIGWTITGVIFFIKPGYQNAYERLSLQTYPFENSLSIKPEVQWQDIRLIKTLLGKHLLINTEQGPLHLDPDTLKDKTQPSPAAIRRLINDAIAANSTRYGDIIKLTNNTATTSTGVEITLNWQTLTLTQKGDDTRLINVLYKIHYLQWTPFDQVNQVLGVLGLLLLLTLTLVGVKLYLTNKEK